MERSALPFVRGLRGRVRKWSGFALLAVASNPLAGAADAHGLPLAEFGGMSIDPAQPIPIYYQLKTLLLEEILSGRYGSDARLPTEHELCDQYAISRTPVTRALSELAEEGVILRHRRRGTFVESSLAPRGGPISRRFGSSSRRGRGEISSATPPPTRSRSTWSRSRCGRCIRC